MEKLDLTPDNLVRVGITPEILKNPNAFLKWSFNNQKIYIDIQNNCIYTDCENSDNNDLHLIKSFFKNESEYWEFINLLIEKSNFEFDSVLNNLPIVNQKEFLINTIPKLNKNVKKAKKVLYNKMLNEITGTTKQEAKNINPYPLLFINFEVYRGFLEYTKNHIIEFYKDYSYLKKRLQKEKLIHYHKDTDFLNFIFNEMKLIKKSDYDNYFIK